MSDAAMVTETIREAIGKSKAISNCIVAPDDTMILQLAGGDVYSLRVDITPLAVTRTDQAPAAVPRLGRKPTSATAKPARAAAKTAAGAKSDSANAPRAKTARGGTRRTPSATTKAKTPDADAAAAAQRLKDAMQAAGMTSGDLASAVGRSPASVGNWRSGSNLPSAQLRRSIEAALGVEPGSIFPVETSEAEAAATALDQTEVAQPAPEIDADDDTARAEEN